MRYFFIDLLQHGLKALLSLTFLCLLYFNLSSWCVVGEVLVTPIAASQCSTPMQTAIDPNTGTLYIACYTSGILAVNGSSTKIVVSGTQCTQPVGLALNMALNMLYATCSSGQIVVVNMTSSAVTRVSTGCQLGLCAVTYHPKSGHVYAMCGDGAMMTINSGVLLNVTQLTPFQDYETVCRIVLDPVRDIFYMTGPNSVLSLNLSDYSIKTIYAMGYTLTDVFYADPGTGVVYGGNVANVFTITNGIAKLFATRSQTRSCSVVSIGVDPRTGVMYLGCNSMPNIVSYFNGVATVLSSAGCTMPQYFTIDPNAGTVYVSCQMYGGVLALSGAAYNSIASSDVSTVLEINPRTGAAYIDSGLGVAMLYPNGTIQPFVNTQPFDDVNSLSALAFNSVDGHLFIGLWDVFVEVDGNGALVKQMPLPLVQSIAINVRTQFVYALCSNGSLFSVHGGSYSPVPLGGCTSPSAVVADSNRNITYVSCVGYGVISINSTKMALITSTCAVPNKLAVHPTSGVLLMACGNLGLLALNSSGVLTTVVGSDHCRSPNGLIVNSGNGIFYAACINGIISITIPNNGTDVLHPVVSSLSTPNICVTDAKYLLSNLASDPKSGRLYALCGDGTILMVNSLIGSCPAGTVFASAFGCSPCNAGTYRSYESVKSDRNNLLQDTADCTTCSPGSISPRPGAAVCSICLPGQAYQQSYVCTNCTSGYFANNATSSCYPCPLGTFSDSSMATSCSPCGVGFFAGAYASPSCLPCQPGQFNNISQASSCSPCSLGKFSNGTGLSKCFDCPAGSVALEMGSVSCSPCPPGAFAYNRTDVQCTVCPVGRAQSSTGSTACDACDVGRYSLLAGAVACIDCPPASFSNISAASSCSLCPANFFTNTTRQSKCAACSSGSFSSVGAVNCNPCAAGTYANSSGGCLTCWTGTYQDQIGQSSCKQCEMGKYQFLASVPTVSCTLCPPGLFQNVSGSTSCVYCDAGRYQSQLGSSQCINCLPGTFQPYWPSQQQGAAFCQPCELGKFAENSATIACTPCPLGSISNSSGSSSCIQCPSGSSTPTEGSVNCIGCGAGAYYDTLAGICRNCPAGRFQPTDNGVTSCQLCPTGSYQNLTNSPAPQCILCPQGRFASDVGQTECLPCPHGTATNEFGQTACSECSHGYMQPSDFGAISCVQCGRGAFSSDGATSECQLCSVGKFAKEENSTECEACLPGHYSDEIGASTCLSCAPGRFNPTVGKSTCLKCEPGRYAGNYGGSSCEPCTPGSYAAGNSSNQCYTCPLGSYQLMAAASFCISCSDLSGVECSNGNVTVLPGYFAFVQVSSMELLTVPCSSNTACVGGQIEYQCGAHRLQDMNNLLCGSCEAGYTESSGECLYCSGVNGGLLVALLIASWACVLFFHHHTASKSNALMTIFMYFLQSSLLLTGPIGSWLGWLNIFSLSPLNTTSSYSAQCIMPLGPYENLALGVAMSIIFFIFNAITFLLQWLGYHFLYQPWRKTKEEDASIDATKTHDSQRHPVCCCPTRVSMCSASGWIIYLFGHFHAYRYVRSTVVLLLFCYAQVAEAIFRYLQCVHVADEYLVYTAPAVSCEDSKYKSWLPVVIFLLIVYIIGFPLFIIITLWKNKEHIRGALAVEQADNKAQPRKDEKSYSDAVEVHPSQSSESSSLPAPHDQSAQMSSMSKRTLFHQRWFMLYEPYDKSMYFWHAFILLRRTIIIVLFTFLSEHQRERQTAIVYFHAICLLLTVHLKPFHKVLDNWVECISLILLMAIGLIMVDSPQPPYPLLQEFFLTLFVLVPTFAFFVLFFLLRAAATQTRTPLKSSNFSRMPQSNTPTMSMLLRFFVWSEENAHQEIDSKVDANTPQGTLPLSPSTRISDFPAGAKSDSFSVAPGQSNRALYSPTVATRPFIKLNTDVLCSSPAPLTATSVNGRIRTSAQVELQTFPLHPKNSSSVSLFSTIHPGHLPANSNSLSLALNQSHEANHGSNQN